MATFGASKKTAWKERRKIIKKSVEEKKDFESQLLGLQGKDKLLFDIRTLKTTIINCKYDLSKSPDNVAIENKLQVAQDQLALKEKELFNIK